MDKIGGFVLLVAQRALSVVGKYLDDMLLVAAGGCFTAGSFELLGRPWALVTAGVCLTVYAVIVARSRRGGPRG